MNKYLDGWKCEEAVCFAVGGYKSIKHIESILEDTPVDFAYDGDRSPQWTQDDVEELNRASAALGSAEDLLEALYHSVEIAIEHFHFAEKCEHAHMGHMLPEDLVLEQPEEHTEIELYRYKPDTPLKEIKIKKKSFAIWLHMLGELKMAEKVCPDLNVSEVLKGRDQARSSTLSDFSNMFQGENSSYLGIDEEQIPDNLYLALSLYKQAWHDLPDDMRKPLKSELEDLLKQNGLTDNAELINSIIKVSTPNNVKLGGKQSPDLKPWKPVEQRK